MDRATTRPTKVLTSLGIAIAITIVIFMTYDAKGGWDFVLPFRGRKLAGLVLVATAIAISTVLFQTVTNNRILTPSIMGFDALYRMIQTLLIFFLGSIELQNIDTHMLFFTEAAIMMVFSGLLFQWLFSGAVRDLHLLVLVGFVFGALFRSLSDFMQRIINPNDFTVLQDRTFANFSTIDETLLGISAILIVGIGSLAWSMHRKLDVLALGRETATNLGVNFRQTVLIVLAMVSVLVSISTALVGPVTFFGLLVANLAYALLGSSRHAITLPAAILIAILCLAGGQLILERLLEFNTSLSIIIEFIGGIVFIILLLRGNTK